MVQTRKGRKFVIVRDFHVSVCSLNSYSAFGRIPIDNFAFWNKQPKLAHIKNANSSAEAQVNINRSVNVNNSNGSNSNAIQTVKASTPYRPNTTTCIASTTNANKIYSINTTSSITSTANTCIILAVNATTNTNLVQQSENDDEVDFVKISYRSTPKAGKFHLSEQDISTISTRDWLTDHIVGAAQPVLREQFPHARGLENITLGPFFNFLFKKANFHKSWNTLHQSYTRNEPVLRPLYQMCNTSTITMTVEFMLLLFWCRYHMASILLIWHLTGCW